MAGQATLIGSAVVSALGLLLGGGYLGTRVLGRRSTRRGLFAGAALSASRRRRSLAAGLVMAISMAFFVGVNFLDHHSDPRLFVYYWAVVMGLVCWLCLLALADIRHARAARRQHLADAVRKAAESMRDLRRGNE
jgi:peptidoglycan/LPS O-acetylase OafA/YrhL